MKGRNYLWSLFAMIIAIFSLATFTSCKEEEEEIDENGWVKTYPKSENYDKFTVTNINGEIKFNKKLNKYEFIPDNTKDFRQKELIWGDEGGDRLFIIIENDSKEIGNHLGKITISGIAQFKYAKVPKGENPFGLFDYYYSLKIDNYSGTKTRAFTENIVYICDTPVSNPPAWLFSRSTPSSFNFISYNFKLYVHIVRSSEGEGYSSSISNTILNNLNNYYNGSNISFSLIGTDYINNDNYNLMSYEDASKPKANGLFNQNSHTNAIDIYIISNGENLYFEEKGKKYILNGKAENIISTALLIRNQNYNTSTLAHEIGHCLGLYHTHHGTSQNEKGTPELANGSNAATAGDFIIDTPADPCEWDGFGNYVGDNLTDANGDKYNPDPLNLMSYSGHYNRGKITPKQCEMMYESIANTRALQMTCTTSNVSISGPDIINSSATYSINVSDDYTVTWNITVETFTSMTESTKTYMSATGKSFVLNNPNANATSQKYTITANIKNKKGVTFQQSKTAYHVIPSATTGTFKWASELSGYSTYTKIGYLDPGKAGSYNTISVYQNGDLYFYYTDACGVNTYNNSYFNFVLNDNYSNFTKYTGGYHAYKCKREARPGSYTAILQVVAGSYSKLIPLNIQILQNPNPNCNDEEPNDSLEILKTKKISKYIKRL